MTDQTIPDEIRTAIAGELDRIETEEGCRILLAVESGSRAWGFHSPDSDFDVRFIYVQRPEWYLSIDLETRRDVIERPISDELDISGWDIRKALRLFTKSNPPLLEWLASPIVYRLSSGFREALLALLPEYHSTTRSYYHYRQMAEKNYRAYLQGDVVRLKKYLYVLRPLFAVRWLQQGRGVVPMEFARLLVTIEDQPDLVEAVNALVERKMSGEELAEGPAIPVITSFVREELARLEATHVEKAAPVPGVESLDRLFRTMLETVWTTP